jgi:mono/diheme cytochrome c family protein
MKRNQLTGIRLRTSTGIRLFVLLVGTISMWPTRAATQTAASTLGRGDNVLYGELAKAPSKAVTRRNPLEHDPEAVVAGAKLYGLHCAECHGQTGEGGQGSKKGPSLRAGEVQQSSAGTLFWVLTNGVVRRGMPVWSKLPEPQRWQLVAFIKSLGSPSTKAIAADGAKP